MAPHLVLFAGVNGAGKTTFFRSGLWTCGAPEAMVRVNADELLVQAGGSWQSERDQIRAGRAAVELTHRLLAARTSFNQETTLAGRTILRTLHQAQELGYRTSLFYLDVASPKIAQARVAHREAVGGHGVDPEVVCRRWHRSRENFRRALGIVDEAFLYDNTHDLTLVARFERGRDPVSYPRRYDVGWLREEHTAEGLSEGLWTPA